MVRTINYKKTVIIFAFLFSTLIVQAQNTKTFRVHKNIVHKIDLTNTSSKVILGINDSLAIFYPEELIYLEGIAIDINIPELAVAWRDSMAWSLFDSVTPTPKNEIIDYTGKALSFALLPPKHSLSLIIPLTENTSIKDNPYATKFELIPNKESGYLFIHLQQVMKGTPDEFENLKFEVTIRPLLKNLGKLELELTAPDQTSAVQQCALFIDKKPFDLNDLNESDFYLESGIHTVSIVSEFYRSELRTIQIDKAKTTKLPIHLRSIEPSLIISAPVSTTVNFDDKLIENTETEFIITEGEHIVKFTLGNYEVEKKFTAVKGQSYNVSLIIEAEVTEEK